MDKGITRSRVLQSDRLILRGPIVKVGKDGREKKLITSVEISGLRPSLFVESPVLCIFDENTGGNYFY